MMPVTGPSNPSASKSAHSHSGSPAGKSRPFSALALGDSDPVRHSSSPVNGLIVASLRYWYESMSRTPNRDGSHPLDLPVSSIVRSCALRSTSMPALHRRIMPNCSPIADGGTRKCSAVEDFARRGACPPLGSGRGGYRTHRAQFAVPERQLEALGYPWCVQDRNNSYDWNRTKMLPSNQTTMPTLHRAKRAEFIGNGG